MANRKQPFGYKMEQGQIVAHLREAEVVRMIFAQYNSGASMGALAQMLNKQDIPYEDGKLWNKNMAARILADKRYLGAGGYPVIMDDDSFQKAREKREKKQCPVQKTAAQKVLRRLSGQAVSAQVERRVMEMLFPVTPVNAAGLSRALRASLQTRNIAVTCCCKKHTSAIV